MYGRRVRKGVLSMDKLQLAGFSNSKVNTKAMPCKLVMCLFIYILQVFFLIVKYLKHAKRLYELIMCLA